jgi:hypothetical protein
MNRTRISLDRARMMTGCRGKVTKPSGIALIFVISFLFFFLATFPSKSVYFSWLYA